MAVLKHISVKGSNGGDALDYVMYKHNEMTGEMLTDGQGNPIMRDEFYLDGINCEPYSFAAECREVNELYGKNQKPEDIKAHHFIVSYDPKDAEDHGLTGPKAQQISMEFAEKCFPGFQMIVCTHMDGSNESGNIHTHIMMNSVRKYDTEPEAFGEREIDHKAGYKLHLTDDYLRYMKQELMNLCDREGLHQVDLLSPAERRITDGEFRVKQHGQDRLDNLKECNGLETEKSVFQTQKQYLREVVEKVAPRATSFDDFCEIMKKEYNITVKESRGRISYLHPDREKYITGRALGSAYEKDAVIKEIVTKQTAHRMEYNPTVQDLKIPQVPKTIEDCHRAFVMRTDLRLVVRLQTCAKARESASYASKVMVSNVKAMAETILFVQQNGFNTMEELLEAFAVTEDTCNRINDDITRERKTIKTVNEDIHFLGQYLLYKQAYDEINNEKNIVAGNEVQANDISTYKNAINYIRKKYGNTKLPTLKILKMQKKNSIERIEYLEGQRHKSMTQQNVFKVAIKNISEILGEEKHHEVNFYHDNNHQSVTKKKEFVDGKR